MDMLILNESQFVNLLPQSFSYNRNDAHTKIIMTFFIISEIHYAST